MTTIINSLIDSLLNKNESVLFELLENFEKEFLENIFDIHSNTHQGLFDLLDDVKYNNDDLELKLLVLNNLGSQVLENEKTREKYFNKNKFNIFQKLIYELNKNYFQKFKFIIQDKLYQTELDAAFYTAAYGILSDNTVEVNTVLKSFDFYIAIKSYENELDLLEGYIIYLFIRIAIRIQNNKEKESIDKIIAEADQLIKSIISNVKSEQEYIATGLKLSSYANLLYILKEYYYFLFSGECTNGANFEALLDSILFNAHKSIGNNQKLGNKIILIRYALKNLYAKSFWNIAETSPLIKKFFQKTINDDNYILNLMPSQSRTIHDLLSAKRAYVVSMPTSAGKTLLAELYLLYNFHIHRSDNNEYPLACYIVPTNALINQVKHKLEKELSGLNINIESVLPYYDIDEIENEILEKQKINILISTPEKLDFLVRSDNALLRDLKIVILDEAHNLSDKTRGSKFELLLATLKQKYKGLQYLLLTPFVKEKSAQQISEWLADSSEASSVIASEWSPSKQYIGYSIFNQNYSQVVYLPSARNNIVKEDIVIDFDKTVDYVKNFLNVPKIKREHRTTVLLEKYLNIGTCTLVLCETVPDTKNTAMTTLLYFKQKNLLENIEDVPQIKNLIAFINNEDAGNKELLECLKFGVAFHNSKMSQHLKESIELLVSDGLIKILCATTTLAQGMNFPITNVIFQFYARKDKEHNKKTKKQLALTSSEFMNIAGRAGRAYYDSEGHIILSQSSKQETSKELKNQLITYIKDDKKEIISALTEFFKLLDENESINLHMLNSNQSVTNFLQYINHIIRVVYNNDFDTASRELSQILNSSLIYKQLGKKEGFIESQQKIRNFSKKYIEQIKDKNFGELKLADLSGISDISLSFLSGKIREYKKELKAENKNVSEYIDIHSIITHDKKYKKLSKLIEIIASIPEMKMEIGHTKGKFNAERVAIMIIEWVQGNSINEISHKLQSELRDNRKFEEIIDESNHYINGAMKNFIPWGVKIYQALTEKENEKHENLPSYIYYGVNDNESVILSKLNIPRFMIDNYKKKIYSKFGKDSICVSNMTLLKEFIQSDYAKAENT